MILINRIKEHKSYDNAVASCLNECQGQPSKCGLASAAQLYSWVKKGVPDKLKGRYFRVNGLKVIFTFHMINQTINYYSFNNSYSF